MAKQAAIPIVRRLRKLHLCKALSLLAVQEPLASTLMCTLTGPLAVTSTKPSGAT